VRFNLGMLKPNRSPPQFPMPTSKLSRVLYRLDRMPKPAAIASGLAAGVCAALWGLAWPGYGAAVFLGLLVLAGFIAWSGEPWSVVETVAPPGQAKAERAPAPNPPQDPLWVSIPGGSFAMGSNEYDDERPIHTVRISPFQLMKVPVTRRQYQAVMGEDPGWPAVAEISRSASALRKDCGQPWAWSVRKSSNSWWGTLSKRGRMRKRHFSSVHSALVALSNWAIAACLSACASIARLHIRRMSGGQRVAR